VTVGGGLLPSSLLHGSLPPVLWWCLVSRCLSKLILQIPTGKADICTGGWEKPRGELDHPLTIPLEARSLTSGSRYDR
jgi:hypothetical protein